MIYDRAHDLARALKASPEYQAFLKAKEALAPDGEAKKMVRDFLLKKAELEYEAMTGKSEDKAKIEQLQRMYELIAYNSKAREFMEAHTRFQRIMADVSKIIGEAVAEGLDIFAKD
ncbi:MAG: YlbF family regulator [Negativicutes bacterium]|nr:YlbF family regulator [Negativicutes bacterium]